MLSTTLDDLSTRFTCVRLTRRKKKKPLGSPATPKKKPQVGMSEIVSPMNTKYPTFVWGVPADADLNSSCLFLGLDKLMMASWIVLTWVATTERTSIGILLNSSKHHHAPVWARPRKCHQWTEIHLIGAIEHVAWNGMGTCKILRCL